VCVPLDRKEKAVCHHCRHEVELSDRDLRCIDTIILHGDTAARPPFNFACQSCETVFTYDYKPLVSEEKLEPHLQAFYVEQVMCESCKTPVDIIVMSPRDAKISERKSWKQIWSKHKPWHRSA